MTDHDRSRHQSGTGSRTTSGPVRRRRFLTTVAAATGLGLGSSGASADAYGGTPHPVPGRIEAEDYDPGVEGTDYHDATAGNAGGAYRSDDVDIGAGGSGYHVGWIQTGEWLKYTSSVQSAGTYEVTARVASNAGGGTFSIEQDRNVVGVIDAPDTGGWQSWTTRSTEVDLDSGQHTIAVYAGEGGFNLDWLEFDRAGDGAGGGGGGDILDDLDGRSWTRTWNDEFDQGSLDTSIWTDHIGNGHDYGGAGWWNDELQYYSRDNRWLEDGKLVIEAREEQVSDQYGTYDYTSSKLVTQDTLNKQFGRIDVCARLPRGQGLWPAIWMLSDSNTTWPEGGEIDIMELIGDDPDLVHGTAHGPGFLGPDGISGSSQLPSGTFNDDFHVFSIVWDPGEIKWFVDGEQFHGVTRAEAESRGGDWPFDSYRYYLILNVAVGGEWPGSPDQTTEFPQRMEIEYARFYDEA